jgi:hypothetical protein
MFKKFREWLKFREKENKEKSLRAFAVGINSTTGKDSHIILLDYDTKIIENIIHSIIELQEFWNLGKADIYQTKNGYHVFFWHDQVPYARLKMIIDFAKYVDPMYKYISKFYNHKTIRVSGKYQYSDIVYVSTIPGKRKPTKQEIEIGEAKRMEHSAYIKNISK